MNFIDGRISKINTSGQLSLVSVSAKDLTLTAVIIDTPETVDYLVLDQPIRVLFKETEVILATPDIQGIGLLNQIPGVVRQIEMEPLLSRIRIATSVGNIKAVVTSEAVRILNLEVGLSVIALIKTNEIMLAQ